jgi:predicted O-methyltransferase YrrM
MSIERFVAEVATRETSLQAELRAETARLPLGAMMTGPDFAALLTMLVRLTGARRAIEVGTFTGYSALAIATGLPPDGRLIACDISSEWTSIARRYWARAGLDDRIELRLAPARDTLAALIAEGEAGRFDFAFIDADKTNYDSYYEACLRLLRPGGLIVLENMLWGGAVADASARDASTRALRALNLKIRDDERVDACLLTVADGAMLARKRG